MAGVVVGGPRTYSGERDTEGHRTYTVVHLVKCSDSASADTGTATPGGGGIVDGPETAMIASGLPAIGASWYFGNGDVWAYCYPDMRATIEQEREGDRPAIWRIEQKFSTKPLTRCQTNTIENPLLEPMKLSGGFIKYTKEATKDRNGYWIQNSAHQQIRGAQVEFDANRPTVHVEQNVLNLELPLITSMVDTLNNATLWGLSARCIKLSNASWERMLYGTCTYYFKRIFDFDVMYETFDRDLLDKGTKMIDGTWSKTVPYTYTKKSYADASNPLHFIVATDPYGHPQEVLLNGQGEPHDTLGTSAAPVPLGDVGTSLHLEYYDESNFLLLGIPTSLS